MTMQKQIQCGNCQRISGKMFILSLVGDARLITQLAELERMALVQYFTPTVVVVGLEIRGRRASPSGRWSRPGRRPPPEAARRRG